MKQAAPMVLVIALVMSILFTPAARGDDEPRRDGLDPCVDAATEAELLTCRRQRFADSENEVDGLYQELRKSYSKDEPKLLALLEEAQAAWHTYRDAQCRVDTYYSVSGSAYEVYWLDCLEKSNRARAQQLEWLLDSP
jgi:uncharacterized protein YecT (DUF1311 family)